MTDGEDTTVEHTRYRQAQTSNALGDKNNPFERRLQPSSVHTLEVESDWIVEEVEAADAEQEEASDQQE